jgi:two-component system phosphate regulon sensor histidine kinase PhoR
MDFLKSIFPQLVIAGILSLLVGVAAFLFVGEFGSFAFAASCLITLFAFLSILLSFKWLENWQKKHPELDAKVPVVEYKPVENDALNNASPQLRAWAENKTSEISHLREMARYRKEFLGNVSHELKTPIFTIQGYISTLLDGGLEDRTINRSYLEKAEKGINRLISVVSDLEKISKLESPELKLDIEKFNMIELTREVFDLEEMHAQSRNISLRLDADSRWPVMVQADKKRIVEVMSNLITNSIKYGKYGGTTRVRFSDSDGRLWTEVCDDGIGIEEQFHSRVFERFFRTDKSRSREQGGSGLGLAIVKHIIEAHNQTISLQSNPKQGTSFIFSLTKA